MTSSGDQTAAPKKRNLKQMLVGLAVGIGLWPVILPYLYIHEPGIYMKSILLITAAIIVSSLLALAIHEFGHAIAGKMAGMVFMNMSIGPIVFIRTGRESKVIFQWPALGYLGRAMLRFPDSIHAEQMESRLKRYVAGGPAANFIAAVIAVSLVYTVLPSGMLLAFAVVNFLLGGVNLIPTQSKGMLTDGSHLSMLTGKTPGKELVLISYRLMQEDPVGADWHPNTVSEAEELIRLHPEHPLTPAVYASLSAYYVPGSLSVSEELGRQIAFRERQQKVDPLQDMADMAMVHTLYEAGKLADEPDIQGKLLRIGETERVTRLFRDAYIAWLDWQPSRLNTVLDELERVLGEWHSLYMEGGYEKRRIRALRDALQSIHSYRLQD